MIVEAVGIATSQGLMKSDPERATALSDAMLAAVQKAQAEGITDNDEIRRLILEARDKVLES